MFSAPIHAIFTSIGILGIGHYLWSLIKHESSRKYSDDFQEHPALTLGICWFLGYFMYEGILLLTALCQFFWPPIILTMEAFITILGGSWLYFQRKNLLQSPKIPLPEIIIFLALSSFVFFLNLYPSYDVDSLAFYFSIIQQWLEHGGKTFSHFNDIRRSVPIGENYIYALGFALQPHSTFFQQLIHAISKIMLMSCVYGGLCSLNIGIFALIGVALIAAEDHIVGSGVNEYVRINMPISASVFIMGYGMFLFFTHKRKEFLIIGILAAFNFISCKYLGLSYFGCLMIVLLLWIFTRQEWKNILFSYQRYPQTLIILIAAAFFTSIPYVYNFFVTGTPFYPSSIGAHSSLYFDSTAVALARGWHYHLNLMEALKSLSAFMVWPGILASKSLLPLALLSSLFLIFAKSRTKLFFNSGMSFFLMSLIAIILTETYLVFEMRYYRYGIGLYVSAATFLIFFIFQSIIDQYKFLQKIQKIIATLLVLFVSIYCMRCELKNTPSSRPTPQQIMTFLTGKISVEEIINNRLPKQHAVYQQIQEENINNQTVGFFLPFNWPQTYYPVRGKNIGFINSAAFPSVTYFNDGLFAQALLDTKIDVIINGLVHSPDYPLKGGAVYKVITQCTETSSSKEIEIIHLSKPCLEEFAKRKSIQEGQNNLNNALKLVAELPRYEPFNPPEYGGPSRIIK